MASIMGGVADEGPRAPLPNARRTTPAPAHAPSLQFLVPLALFPLTVFAISFTVTLLFWPSAPAWALAFGASTALFALTPAFLPVVFPFFPLNTLLGFNGAEAALAEHNPGGVSGPALKKVMFPAAVPLSFLDAMSAILHL